MRIFIILLLILAVGRLYAQESQFSQFFASSAYLNPAFVGLESNTSVAVNYKSAITDKEGSLKELTHASIIHPIQKLTTYVSQSAGVGVTFVQEKTGFEGIYQTTNVLLSGSYVVRFDYEGKKLLSFGLQGGVIQNKLNTSDLQFGSQYNPYIGYDNTLPIESLNQYNNISPTFNYGMVFSKTDHHNPLLSQNSMILGVSFHNINQPKEGFFSNSQMPIHFKAILTARRKLQTNYFIHPSAYVLAVRGVYQVNTGLYISRYFGQQLSTLMQVGTWFRHNDSFIFLTGIQHQNWKAGISFDLNSTSINDNPVINTQKFEPTWELSFAYTFAFKDAIVKVTNPLF